MPNISPDLFDLEFDDAIRGPIHLRFSQRFLVWETSNLVRNGFFIWLHRLDVNYNLDRGEKSLADDFIKSSKSKYLFPLPKKFGLPFDSLNRDNCSASLTRNATERFCSLPSSSLASSVSQERKFLDTSRLFFVRLSRSHTAWKPFALTVVTHRR